MKYTCYASGSSGNLHVLESSTGQKLVLDMGLSWNKIKEYLGGNIVDTWFIVTHIHGDHFKGVKGALSHGCQVRYDIKDGESFVCGDFTVLAFDVLHNVPTVGFYVNHHEMGNLVYLTDSGYVDILFENVSHWLIEANYCEQILEDRAFHSNDTYLADRVWKDHMSIQNCEKLLLSNNLKPAEEIILLHLSDGNSNEKQFVDRIKKSTGKPCYDAKPGLTLNLELWN